jgi:hypothetical protein
VCVTQYFLARGEFNYALSLLLVGSVVVVSDPRSTAAFSFIGHRSLLLVEVVCESPIDASTA